VAAFVRRWTSILPPPEHGELDVKSEPAAWGMMIVAVTLLAFVPGCREDEQNRPLHLEKGVYQGADDAPLAEDERRSLQERAGRQRF